MANFVRFFDNIAFTPQVSDEVKDFFQAQPTTGPGLRVTIAATHSGRVTRNNSFYLPDRMRASTASWTEQYPKPILVHHDDHEDAIGRVCDSRYVDISNGFRDSYNGKVADEVKVISDSLLDAFVDGKLTRKESINVACDHFINDALADDPNYPGLGYIEIVVDITDPDAIQKILDGRYMTGSVGASTDSAVCSLCKQDWAGEEGPCEHRPGRSYDEFDGKKCVLIAGQFVYDEYSFVNKPADTLSRVIGINRDGVMDYVELDADESKPREAILICDSFSEEEKSMLVITLEDAVSLLQKRNDKLEDPEAKIMAQKVLDHVQAQNILLDKEADGENVFFSTADELFKETPPVVESDLVKDFFGDSYAEIVGEDEVEGRQYAEYLFGVVEDATTDEERAILSEMVLDAKLSSEKRKALSGSTFCGPDRSFPVPDCAHYTAAKRLIGRYKGEGDKSRILACVERKGKRLGCGSESKNDEVDPGQFNLDYFDAYVDDELVQMLAGLRSAMTERGTDVKEEVVTDAETEAKLADAQKQIADLQSDIENLNDSLASSVEDLKNQKLARIMDYRKLSGETVEAAVFTDEFSAKTLDECEVILKDYTDKVDCLEISAKIKSGLVGSVDAVIDDPTLVINNTGGPTGETKKYDINMVRNVRDKYIEERFRSVDRAEQFLAHAKNQGWIPRDNPFNAIQDDKS